MSVKIAWEMTGPEAPAAPSHTLTQYGVRCPFCHTSSKKDDDGNLIRSGWIFIPESQATWADYILRATAGQWSVTTPPRPGNENVQPFGMGESWGAPARPLGIGGRFDRMLSGSLGYKFARGRRGIERMPVVSGIKKRIARRPARRADAAKRKPQRSRKSKAGRGLMREIKSLW